MERVAPPVDSLQIAKTELSSNELIRRYNTVRSFTELLCSPLVTEDYVIQSMADCSPTKWHLAHTSWFYETFILKPNISSYKSPHPQYDYLFNSYYNSLGARHCRPKRGLISRPTVADTYAYRKHVDIGVRDVISSLSYTQREQIAPLLELGLNHEQQHQELMITDFKHMFSENPLMPVYHELKQKSAINLEPLRWQRFDAGLYKIGYEGNGFAFDNETPRHPEYLAEFEIADRLVTNGEYIEFINDGGYNRPEFWLSEGWATIQSRIWQAPLYWMPTLHNNWEHFTLHGVVPVDPNEPVSHVSYFEAEAYAHWAKARLATESEWEVASEFAPMRGNFADSMRLHPEASSGSGLLQMLGDTWEWTRSQYDAYPGYRQPDGALGEYNGKFMCNQFVMRGGSCATPESHIRRTYRNFFPPDARWQFTGIRLARDVR